MKGGSLGTADVSRGLEQGPCVLGQIHGPKAEKSVKGPSQRILPPRAVGL